MIWLALCFLKFWNSESEDDFFFCLITTDVACNSSKLIIASLCRIFKMTSWILIDPLGNILFNILIHFASLCRWFLIYEKSIWSTALELSIQKPSIPESDHAVNKLWSTFKMVIKSFWSIFEGLAIRNIYWNDKMHRNRIKMNFESISKMDQTQFLDQIQETNDLQFLPSGSKKSLSHTNFTKVHQNPIKINFEPFSKVDQTQFRDKF